MKLDLGFKPTSSEREEFFIFVGNGPGVVRGRHSCHDEERSRQVRTPEGKKYRVKVEPSDCSRSQGCEGDCDESGSSTHGGSTIQGPQTESGMARSQETTGTVSRSLIGKNFSTGSQR